MGWKPCSCIPLAAFVRACRPRQRAVFAAAASPITSRPSPMRSTAAGWTAGREAVSKIVGRDPEQLDGAGVCARGDRKPCRELLRRHRRAGLLVRRRRAGRRRRLQGRQHRRFDDRPPHAEARGVRLGVGPLRRSGQPAGLAAHGAAAGRRRRAAAEGGRQGGLAGRLARREKAPLAQCRLAGSGDGRRARRGAGRAAQLWRRAWATTPSWAKAGARDVPRADIRRAIRLFWIADVLLLALLGTRRRLLMGGSRL